MVPDPSGKLACRPPIARGGSRRAEDTPVTPLAETPRAFALRAPDIRWGLRARHDLAPEAPVRPARQSEVGRCMPRTQGRCPSRLSHRPRQHASYVHLGSERLGEDPGALEVAFEVSRITYSKAPKAHKQEWELAARVGGVHQLLLSPKDGLATHRVADERAGRLACRRRVVRTVRSVPRLRDAARGALLHPSGNPRIRAAVPYQIRFCCAGDSLSAVNSLS